MDRSQTRKMFVLIRRVLERIAQDEPDELITSCADIASDYCQKAIQWIDENRDAGSPGWSHRDKEVRRVRHPRC